MIPLLHVSLPLAAGLGGVFIAGALGIPGGAFTGSFIGSGFITLVFSSAKQMPRWMLNFAMYIMGLTIGISVTRETLGVIASAFLPIIFMIAALIILSYLAARLVSRYTNISFTTVLCGASPGAASAMVVLSSELGGDAALVAMFHILRKFALALIIPLVMVFIRSGQETPAVLPQILDPAAIADGTLLRYGKMAALVLLGFPAVLLFRRIKVPAADIMAGMVTAAVLNSLFLHLDGLPPVWQVFSVWIIGSNIGMQMNRQTLVSMKKHLPIGLLLTFLLLGIGFLLGWIMYRTTSIDLTTAIMGVCPGAIEMMLVLADDVGADVPLVAAMQVTRLIAVLSVLPFLVSKTKKEGK